MTNNIKPETIERYTALWNKIQASGFPLSELETVSQTDFQARTNIKGSGQFRLAKSLARQTERQNQVNTYLEVKTIPKTIIKRLPEKQLISKYERPYREKSDITFHKNKFKVGGYDKHSANFSSNTYSADDFKEHLGSVVDKALNSNSKFLKDDKKGFSIKSRVSLKIFNPKDDSVSEVFFYANGKVSRTLKSSMKDIERFNDSFNAYLERLIQSELTYSIQTTYTTIGVFG